MTRNMACRRRAFTLFDLLEWSLALSLTIWLSNVGQASFGWLGAIGGGVLGFFGGIVLGRVPFAISLAILRLSLKRSSTEKLKSKLNEQYFVSHLLIAEMVGRGEQVEQFWPYVLSQIQSESADRQRFGWHNLNIWFPQFVQRVEDFDPNASTESCREKR